MSVFDKPQQPRMYDVEEWGENDKGCFSFTSGRWIPKEDKGYSTPPPLNQGFTWPTHYLEDAEEKKERY